MTRFDPYQMESLNGSSSGSDSQSTTVDHGAGAGAVVTLMVSPMLVKAGDSYGEGYDDMPEIIEKAVVHVVSKYLWDDNNNGYAQSHSQQPGPSPSASPSPISSSVGRGAPRGTSRNRGGRDGGMTPGPESAASAMVVYRALTTTSSRSGGTMAAGRRYVTRPTAALTTGEKMKEGGAGKKGKGKKLWTGLKRRTALKGARSEVYDD